ncbi:RNA recognition motif domain-containing protein [Ditylenchus destructor]|nr:RNA recognition motif domain-containing protein [Ditylenchus destructor]
MLNFNRFIPTTISRSDRAVRILQTLGYLMISRRNLHKLIVKGLSENTTCLSLLHYYSRFGEVRGIRLVEGSSLRFAYIYYDKFETISTALRSGSHVIDGKTLSPLGTGIECKDDELEDADYFLATSCGSKTVGTARSDSNIGIPRRSNEQCTKDNKTLSNAEPILCETTEVTALSKQARNLPRLQNRTSEEQNTTIKKWLKPLDYKHKLPESTEKVYTYPTQFKYDGIGNRSMESTLIIHRVSAKLSSGLIIKYYQQFGHVLSASFHNIHRDRFGPFCLVTFSTQDEMELALYKRPNVIDDIAWLNAHHVRCPKRTYVIENLSPLTTDESLWRLLRPLGPMFECTVARDSITGQSLGYAHVTFFYGEDYIRSIRRLAVVDGAIPQVKPYYFSEKSFRVPDIGTLSTPHQTDVPKPIENMPNKPMHSTLVIRTPPISLKTTDITQYFAKYGNIIRSGHYYSTNLKDWGRFFLLTYITKADLDRALASVPHVVNGQTLNVEQVRNPERTFVFKNLGPDTTSESLWNALQKFGPLIEATVVRDPRTKKSMGYGYGTFLDTFKKNPDDFFQMKWIIDRHVVSTEAFKYEPSIHYYVGSVKKKANKLARQVNPLRIIMDRLRSSKQ